MNNKNAIDSANIVFSCMLAAILLGPTLFTFLMLLITEKKSFV